MLVKLQSVSDLGIRFHGRFLDWNVHRLNCISIRSNWQTFLNFFELFTSQGPLELWNTRWLGPSNDLGLSLSAWQIFQGTLFGGTDSRLSTWFGDYNLRVDHSSAINLGMLGLVIT